MFYAGKLSKYVFNNVDPKKTAVRMPTAGHSYDDGDVICIDSDDDDEIDVGEPERTARVAQNGEDLSW
jgi:hypothetical protein